MMKSIPPVLARVVMTVICLALLGVTMSVSPSVHAATKRVTTVRASCYGASCYNKDPYQAGCASNVRQVNTAIIDNSGTNIGAIFNYYSVNCNANWAEGELFGSSGGAQLKITISTSGEATLCYPDNCSSYYNGSATAWTNMVNGTNVATACGSATSSRQYPRRSSACLDY